MLERTGKKGVRYLEAPVAGTKPHAERAELVFFAGGNEADFREARHFFDKMGKRSIFMGETGKGASFKMLMNLMLAQFTAVFAETVSLGTKLGMEEKELFQSLSDLPISPPYLKFKSELLSKKEEDTQFPLELMYKDLHLGLLTAYEAQHPLFLAGVTRELFGQATEADWGRKDFFEIYNFLKTRK
jgi:3-hydroxyisobutyrate dehydrogenase/glyoxylate/succinic semialdehyde reductase